MSKVLAANAGALLLEKVIDDLYSIATGAVRGQIQKLRVETCAC